MKIDPETFSNGLADVIEKVVRPLRDEIAATRSVKLLPHDVAGIGEDLGEITRAQIEKAVKPLLARLSALENRPSTNYRGVFDPAETYERADLCTHDGAVWFACTSTNERPGKSASWKLMLKSGR